MMNLSLYFRCSVPHTKFHMAQEITHTNLIGAAEVGSFALRPLGHLVDDVVQDHDVLQEETEIQYLRHVARGMPRFIPMIGISDHLTLFPLKR
jgi:hypothetical protein